MAARARGWCGGVVGGSRGHGSQTTDGASALIVMPKRSAPAAARARAPKAHDAGLGGGVQRRGREGVQGRVGGGAHDGAAVALVGWLAGRRGGGGRLLHVVDGQFDG